MKRHILMNPGPVMTSDFVKQAMIHADICHRDEQFSELLKSVQEKLLKVFRADKTYSTVVITGSGTAVMEAAISSAITQDEKVLIITNGAFGERFIEIAELHKLNVVPLKYKWGEQFNINQVEEMLKSEPKIGTIVMNHHETSLGILNPVTKIGELARKYNKMFIIDSVSSLGAEDINVVRDNIDICVASPNKCIHGMPGSSFACLSQRAIEKMKGIKPRSYYLDLYKYYKYSNETTQTPYTPSVHTYSALNAALTEVLEQGLENRWKHYKLLSSMIRDGIKKMNLGFKLLLQPQYMSNSITSILLPENVHYPELYKKMKEKGFIIYGAKPPYKDKMFQVANMGNLTVEDIKNFLTALEQSVREIQNASKV